MSIGLLHKPTQADIEKINGLNEDLSPADEVASEEAPERDPNQDQFVE
jgi:hypothetical protein